jgi:5-oxoprolinase (ATP-hydrolysing) subunit A
MIWLNADVGERHSALDDGSEEELVSLLHWANIACGGHAGDELSMSRVLELCRRYGVQAGAHPGYPDRAGFGREVLDIAPEALAATVFEQIKRLAEIARSLGVEIRHVKPHGALYNQAASDPGVASAIAKGVALWSRELVLVGLARSRTLEVWGNAGFTTVAEAFADRKYEPDGTLRPRRYPDALITDPAQAADQARRFSAEGAAGTICVHSDTPNAAAIARAVRAALNPPA